MSMEDINSMFDSLIEENFEETEDPMDDDEMDLFISRVNHKERRKMLDLFPQKSFDEWTEKEFDMSYQIASILDDEEIIPLTTKQILDAMKRYFPGDLYYVNRFKEAQKENDKESAIGYLEEGIKEVEFAYRTAVEMIRYSRDILLDFDRAVRAEEYILRIGIFPNPDSGRALIEIMKLEATILMNKVMSGQTVNNNERIQLYNSVETLRAFDDPYKREIDEIQSYVNLIECVYNRMRHDKGNNYE